MICSSEMNTTYKLIMMDMGGVLAIHTDQSMEKNLLQMFNIHGYSSFTDLNPSLPKLLELHSKGSIDEDEMWRRFTALTNIAVPASDHSLWATFFHPQLDKDVSALIEKIKENGYRIVCATNTEMAHYQYHLSHGQYSQFDKVYASCFIKQVKPDKEFFRYILHSENVSASEVIFIDDYQSNCKSASDLGINAHQFYTATKLEKYLKDLRVI